MTKSAIIDAVLKEAGIMDYVRSLAAKFKIKIPTKLEALAKLEQFLRKNKEKVDEAIKVYNSVLAKKSNVIEAAFLDKNLILIVLSLFIAFGKMPANAQEADSLLQKETRSTLEYLSPFVSLIDFNKILDGMSHAQVSQILGSQGKKIEEQNEITSYKWSNDYNVIIIKFLRDKTISKTQNGLDRPDEYAGHGL